jgi:hypothetical protein
MSEPTTAVALESLQPNSNGYAKHAHKIKNPEDFDTGVVDVLFTDDVEITGQPPPARRKYRTTEANHQQIPSEFSFRYKSTAQFPIFAICIFAQRYQSSSWIKQGMNAASWLLHNRIKNSQ